MRYLRKFKGDQITSDDFQVSGLDVNLHAVPPIEKDSYSHIALDDLPIRVKTRYHKGNNKRIVSAPTFNLVSCCNDLSFNPPPRISDPASIFTSKHRSLPPLPSKVRDTSPITRSRPVLRRSSMPVQPLTRHESKESLDTTVTNIIKIYHDYSPYTFNSTFDVVHAKSDNAGSEENSSISEVCSTTSGETTESADTSLTSFDDTETSRDATVFHAHPVSTDLLKAQSIMARSVSSQEDEPDPVVLVKESSKLEKELCIIEKESIIPSIAKPEYEEHTAIGTILEEEEEHEEEKEHHIQLLKDASTHVHHAILPEIRTKAHDPHQSNPYAKSSLINNARKPPQSCYTKPPQEVQSGVTRAEHAYRSMVHIA